MAKKKVETALAAVDKVVRNMNTDHRIRMLAGQDVLADLSDVQFCECGNRVKIMPKRGGESLFIIAKFLRSDHTKLLALGARPTLMPKQN